jgi:hypothetical protein
MSIPAKLEQKALWRLSQFLIDPDASLSNQRSGTCSSAMGKNRALTSSSPLASLID